MKYATGLLCLVFLFSAGLLAVSCDGSSTGTDEPVEEVFDVSGVAVTGTVEKAAGEDVTFKVYSGKGPKLSDKVILKAESGVDTECQIKSVTSDNFVFTLAESLESGSYTVYILRGSVRKYVGKMLLNITSGQKVEPGEGTTVYGTVECDGKGVPGVVVSDGYEVTVTDASGVYRLKSGKKNGYVFMSVPSGYEVASEGILPKFHATLTANSYTAERHDFNLVKADNDRFTLYILGDMHLANRTNDLAQFASFAADLNSSINSTSGKKYMLTLGDMTWDLYWYSNSFQFPQYINEMNKYFKGVQVFHTMGNHDNDMNEVGDFAKQVKFTKDLAPYYYSFNIGKFHFIVMDDIDYKMVGAGSSLRDQYQRDFTEEQMAWLAKDLSYVPKSTPLIISSHAPVYSPSSATGWRTNLTGKSIAGQANTEDFLNAVSGYKVHFLSGHTHKVFNYYGKEGSGFIEHNLGAVCASWWWSGYLTSGVHISLDGSPGGYSIWKIDGTDIDWIYKATGQDESYQFRAYDMNEVKKVLTMESAGNHPKFASYREEVTKYDANDVLLNVWNYDPEWKVSVTENGKELALTPMWANDPLHMAALTVKRLSTADASTTPSFLTSPWNHFFKVKASSADSTLEIKVTDRFGRTWTETMKRPKAFTTNDYKNK